MEKLVYAKCVKMNIMMTLRVISLWEKQPVPRSLKMVDGWAAFKPSSSKHSPCFDTIVQKGDMDHEFVPFTCLVANIALLHGGSSVCAQEIAQGWHFPPECVNCCIDYIANSSLGRYLPKEWKIQNAEESEYFSLRIQFHFLALIMEPNSPKLVWVDIVIFPWPFALACALFCM